MHKRYLLALLVLVLSFTTLFAQTKIISHKSHSGTDEEFRTSYAEDAEELDGAGMGMAPDPIVQSAKLDSVIFISDSVAVMVTSQYCSRSRHQSNYMGTRWSAGKDTVYYHPLFSRQHSLDSIKAIIQLHYNFKNPVDSVRFIGYDNGTDPRITKSFSVPVAVTGGGNDQPPVSPTTIVLGAIVFLSLLSGFIAWLFSRLPAVS